MNNGVMNRCMGLWFICMVPLGSLAQEYSYVWANQYPALADPEMVCCYDFDGDQQLDDFNGGVMLSLQSLVSEDFQALADQRIIDNAHVRVWRWDQLPASDGSVSLSILLGDVSQPRPVFGRPQRWPDPSVH
ncbi:hypothetical protein [Marinicella meishanensis]|uniref:hypothetical protein n=1 Tax=Marinicella meishanensis TaxID=2873263 RepID=UPI001CC104DC|nr:hypothetical protein [Marinicella sp. NBU2979]